MVQTCAGIRYRMQRKTIALLLLLGLYCISGACAQIATSPDSLRLSLQQLEQRFLDSNLALITSRYEISVAKAAVITAGLFDNPQLTVENVLYNPENKKILDLSWSGTNSAALSQVFSLAGKRNKSVRLAESAVKLSELDFFELLRSLRFALREDFYRMYFAQRAIELYAAQISSLQSVTTSFRAQLEKGNIARKELVRMEALLFSLQSEKAALISQVLETEAELKYLAKIPAATPLSLSWQPPGRLPSLSDFSLEEILHTALEKRTDLASARELQRSHELDLALQKALAMPEIAIGLTYDKQGNFTRNYNGLQLSLPVPLFNRNQGNIAAAKTRIEQGRYQVRQVEESVSQEVYRYYKTALEAEKLATDVPPDFSEDISYLMGEVQKNYLKRNISLLDFLDFYDSFKETQLKLDELRFNRVRSLEAINYAAGAAIIPL